MSTQITPESMAALYADETAMAVQLRRAGVGHLGKDMPVFLHFSDVHNDVARFQRLMAYFEANKDWITDIVHSGDIANDRFPEPIQILEVPGVERVLNVVGNHDALAPETGFDWTQRVSNEDLYARYFAPYYKGWGVEMAENTTYWYKDYEKFGLRLIGVDCSLMDDVAQLVWLTATLASAREKGHHVIIMAHNAPAFAVKIPCGFSSPLKSHDSGDPYSALSTKMQQAVADFKAAGGEFVCYLAGHTHSDFFWYSKDFPDQLVVTVDAASFWGANYWSDTLRAFGTKSEDLFNLFSYDLENHVVKVVRIGANVNCLMQKKDVIAVDYKTMQVIR